MNHQQKTPAHLRHNLPATEPERRAEYNRRYGAWWRKQHPAYMREYHRDYTRKPGPHNSAQCYVRLFHGRNSPDEQLPDWGFDGPLIGPVGVTSTYGTIKLHDPEWVDFTELPYHDSDGLVAYQGKYYGDWEVFFDGDPTLARFRAEGATFYTHAEFVAHVTALRLPAPQTQSA